MHERIEIIAICWVTIWHRAFKYENVVTLALALELDAALAKPNHALFPCAHVAQLGTNCQTGKMC